MKTLDGKRNCNKCGKTLPLERFKKGGETIAVCGDCRADYLREWRTKNQFRFRACCALRNHKTRGFKIEITQPELTRFLERAASIGKCAICDKQMTWRGWGQGVKGWRKRQQPDSVSVDMINPHLKLFSLSNLQVLCNECNATKGNRSMEELVQFCLMVINKFGDNLEVSK